jgi:Holliday junction resolvase RusA-like endonuclease
VARDAGVIDPKAKAIEVDITVFLGMRGKGDVDNFPKVVLDGLVDAGVIRTDARVSDLHVHKRRDQINPRTVILISPLEG